MLPQNSNTQVLLESLIGTKDYQVDKWDLKKGKIVKVKIQITITKENQMIYSQDGLVLRKEFFQDDTRNPEILTTLEQIQCLKWQGEYGLNKKKLGKWTITWNGHAFQNGGGYRDTFGENIILQKWIKVRFLETTYSEFLDVKIKQNYKNSETQVFESGEYLNNQKYGRWNYIYSNKIIGGGLYNEYNQKKGKWIELSDLFRDGTEITFSFDYKQGKKVGIQDIFWRNQKIGGGQYDDKGNENKQGNWLELSDRFSFASQVTYNGGYKDGKKVGRWDIWFRDIEMGREKNNQMIGGGSYNVAGIGLKQGNWVEISDNFYCVSQVMYDGEYQIGKKVGRWDIRYKGDLILPQSGGGTYDKAGDELKLGNWVELSDKFLSFSQVIYNGEYRNGKKISVWVKMEKKEEGFKKLKEIKYDN